MNEQNETTKTKFAINPPPSDGCCEVCGTHKDKVKPFGGKGDPLVGDFTGAKLLKNFRGFPPNDPNPWVSKSWECRECYILDKKEAWEKYKKAHEREDDKRAD